MFNEKIKSKIVVDIKIFNIIFFKYLLSTFLGKYFCYNKRLEIYYYYRLLQILLLLKNNKKILILTNCFELPRVKNV